MTRSAPISAPRSVSTAAEQAGAQRVELCAALFDSGLTPSRRPGADLRPGHDRAGGRALIAELVRQAGDRIIVMPGGGITARNAARVVAATGAREVHFAALSTAPSPAVHRNPHPYMGGELRQPEYQRLVTTAAGITSVLDALRPH